ncbi:hypothetical protein ACFSQQ_19715 [Mesorhizobium kowhaii]|uniref:hypothetical protein n=1 Tax=Mesorhizobium kowhaii TaxID=1300272 RepID=UPI0035E771FC
MSNLVAILIFSAVLIAIQSAVMIFRGKSWGPTSSRLVGFTVVVLAVLILAFSEIPAEQRAPAYALLGVVAGFLAGRPSDSGENG